jgi:hypothetical protein
MERWLKKHLLLTALSAPMIATAVVFATPGRASAGVLDTIQQAFAGNSGGWLGNALNIADATFAGLYTILVFMVICKASASSISGEYTFGTWMWPIGQMLFWSVVPYIALHIIARAVLPELIADAGTMSGLITGEAAPAGPDEVFIVFMNKAVGLLGATTVPLAKALGTAGGVIGLTNLPAVLNATEEFGVGAIVFLIVVVMGALIAIELLFAYISVYIGVAVGAVSLGLLGSPGTAPMAQPFIGSTYGAFLRLIFIFAFIALVVPIIGGWTVTASAQTPAMFMQSAGQLLAAAVAVFYCTWRLGHLADRMSGGAAAGIGGVDFAVSTFGAASRAVSGAKAIAKKAA